MKDWKASLLAISLLSTPLVAEEGMWPFNMLPIDQIRESYGIELSEDWVTRVQKASLRIGYGGSGSFISPDGLVITNHHVGARAIYDLSTQNNDLMENGFIAMTRGDELKCPNAYMDQLISISDVTTEVNKEITNETPAAEREKLRTAAMARIKEQAEEKTGLYPQIVVLYGGAKYQLYLYKRYTDVRLVMAPEKAIAFFGGNSDNFEYPRYDLDVCFFRLYENDKPVNSENHLKWSSAGPVEGEALFVSGNPGRTRRLYTADHLAFFEQLELPLMLRAVRTRIAALQAFSNRSPENQRIAMQELFRSDNREKVYSGFSSSLRESRLVAKKRNEENSLDESELKPWKTLSTALKGAREYYTSYMLLEGVLSQYSKGYGIAKMLVRLADEKSKANEKRLKEYVNSELPRIQEAILTTEPLYSSLEEIDLGTSLAFLATTLGKEDPAVKAALGGKTPEVRAKEISLKTKLYDPNYRARLFNNLDEVTKSQDPLIQLARSLDPYSRAIREKQESELEAVQVDSYAAIMQTLFKRYGESIYPDATFTLRLSYGSMKGYEEEDLAIKPFTTLGGTYQHASAHNNAVPYKLPNSWMKSEKTLDKMAAFNFVSTNDIIGGNSGSPVINGKGEFVGIIFDGNAQSMIWDYEFCDIQGRAVSVHSQGILETLEKIYRARPLVQEIRKAQSGYTQIK